MLSFGGPRFMMPNTGYQKIAKRSALSALHNSRDRSNPPKLYEGTRYSIFQSLQGWTNFCLYGQESASGSSEIMWICGAAGAGKSAICQSLAEWCSEQRLVLASFFFDRLDSARGHEGFLIPTLAYQIARGSPGVREHLNRAIDNDPGIFNQSFEDQINVLLFGPLKAAAKSFRCLENHRSAQIVILVDGLDECERPETQRKIITGLSEFVHSAAQYLPIRLLISSRPQPAIVNTFQILGIPHETLTLNGDYADVRQFLVKSLGHIKRTHPFKQHIPPSWPSDADIDTLVSKSSGHFLFAAECLAYIRSEKDIPSRRLEVVLGARPARGSNGSPFAQIDALYVHILRSAEYSADALRILALVLVAEDFSLKSAVSKLDLTIHDGAIFLADLASIVQVEHDEIRLLQASFQDFLFDASRSGCFHIQASLVHAELACRLLGVATSFTRQGQDQHETPHNEPGMCGHLTKHLAESQATPGLLQALETVSIEGLHGFHQSSQVLETSYGEHYWPTFLEFILCYLKVVRDLSTPIYDNKCDELKAWVSSTVGLQDVSHILRKMVDVVVPTNKFLNHRQMVAIVPPPGDWSGEMAEAFFNSFDPDSLCNESTLLQACALMSNPDYSRMSSREAAAMAVVYLGYALQRHDTSGAHYERACFVLAALPTMLDRAEPLSELTRLECFTKSAMMRHLERGAHIPLYPVVMTAFESYLRRARQDSIAL
ncbi:hypothetical protein D9619_002793 [Psilocybe cf. subviscida]|uniref:Nephrocystin 3-like N-terminal domain-containing protein n=1 Tax=Psilocybe cf. subviscida TaxID=2480587 RepID=A0A8H5AX60_9AGAR|nr:hypothetical protein D9619_002793 [Psilocybe cf. subviscida]